MKLNNRRALILSVVICFLFVCSSVAVAQPPAPTPVYTGSFGGGFALTGGNTETRNFNLAFSLLRDPKTENVVKLSALYLRGTQNKVLSLDRVSVVARDEYKLSGRSFVFGQTEYMRDQFKDIQYLFAPNGGVGYKVLDRDEVKMQISGGAGGIWEKNSFVPVSKSGTLNAGQTYSRKLSSTASFTESIGALWKTNDFSDSLTNFSTSLTSSINKKLELKLEFIDSYKHRPPNPGIKKNDTAFVVAFVVKI